MVHRKRGRFKQPSSCRGSGKVPVSLHGAWKVLCTCWGLQELEVPGTFQGYSPQGLRGNRKRSRASDPRQ